VGPEIFLKTKVGPASEKVENHCSNFAFYPLQYHMHSHHRSNYDEQKAVVVV